MKDDKKGKDGKNLTADDILGFLKKNSGVLQKFNVKRIGLFGSFARGEQSSQSDIDLVVEFKKTSFDNFMDLAFFLEDSFGRKVDLLTPAGIRDIRVKQVVDNIKKGTIYA
ncbi:hypothetical protein A2291_06645 [candidate division WOR-1 bacterium RIFOXYB2_FULL_42_35]|uniref:Polymerase nucleotidyl transferase domain-containing protein n=1 Tax=candidate division WOR-1 bacterium RIFOXYC2_FULL_41_25 TaxID=1802586 RepID=A0A1F4TPF8_UNCSA|nr:MAG: hypothetical protein A2291_06645 [candidate division WOR-1 bacterium RIFOXYB2_FULL_42_35]OGC24559.1 MAG: hypothetical protein A2247_06425 [candidate division WOR-1 bacterium RIFOXYA2_FULL_41_14]OGC34604.1 MAG: hypothetical protein A2462_04660 [candidate division WOR-1 bacterium RIFOXYC2_FULL_41_25]OGC43989.1 MAG: hypothetical protein A2548_06305 [candidate division WOR-1 bacterium RIFOXYD2_FULL_41_8]